MCSRAGSSGSPTPTAGAWTCPFGPRSGRQTSGIAVDGSSWVYFPASPTRMTCFHHGDRMTRHVPTASALLMAAALLLPALGHAQTFKVEKFSIGGDGGTDYLTAEPGTGRVFVSRGTHVMVVDGATGTVLGDIPDTPRTHGIALAPASHHGFITNAGDSSVTLFDLRS